MFFNARVLFLIRNRPPLNWHDGYLCEFSYFSLSLSLSMSSSSVSIILYRIHFCNNKHLAEPMTTIIIYVYICRYIYICNMYIVPI